MDISSVISTSTIQSGLYATNSTPSIATLLSTTATTALTSAVDISGLGQLLSASAIFESGLLKAAAMNQASFSTLTAATQLFVRAFNNFVQSDTMQSSSAVSPSAMFMQVLDGQSSSVNGQSVIASLAEIGITYQPATSVNSAGQMTVDLNVLQSAFDADQQGTVALLAETSQTVGQLASEFTSLMAQSDVLTNNAQNSANSATLNGVLEAGSESSSTNYSAAEVVGGGQTAAATQPAATTTGIESAGVAISQAAGTATPNPVNPTAANTVSTTSSSAVSSAASAAASASTSSATSAATASTTASATTVSASAVMAASTTNSATSVEAVLAALVAGEVTEAVPVSISQIVAATVESAVALQVAQRMVATDKQTSIAAPGVALSGGITGATGTTGTAGTAGTAGAAGTMTGATVAGATTLSGMATTTLPLTSSQVAAAPPEMQVAAAVLNPLIDISNPAIAAAIAAYHMVDGLFDTAWPHDEGVKIEVKGYTEIWPVGEIHAVRLDLYV